MLGEHRHVVGSLAQRRERQADDIEAIQQVGAEAAGCRFSPKIAVRGRHEPHIDPPVKVLPDTPDLSLLDDAQQLGLRPRLQLTDLVEKQRSGVRLLEDAASFLPGGGAREGAARVAEQLRFHEVLLAALRY